MAAGAECWVNSLSLLYDNSSKGKNMCLCCEELKLDIIKAKFEILSYEEIVRVLQEELRNNNLPASEGIHDPGMNKNTSSSYSISSSNEQLAVECEMMYNEQEQIQAETGNLKKDIAEFKYLLTLAKRKGVIEVMQENVNFLTAKTVSINEQTVEVIRNESEWKIVSKGRKSDSRKLNLQDTRPIPVICNSLEPRNKLRNREIKAQNVNNSRLIGLKRQAKNSEYKRKQKVLILGDSHARGMAAELKHNLDKKFDVQGVVKPCSDLFSILNIGINEMTEFTTKDVIVVWGGTRDVSRNETMVGLSHIRKFVEKYNNTNVLVMELPERCDLCSDSCVNFECKSFNRKLKKYLQPFKHASVVEVNYNRNHYTRHGLHLNNKGKEYSAKQIHSEIEKTLREVTDIPVPLNWLDNKRLHEANQYKINECITENSYESLSKEVEQEKRDQENERKNTDKRDLVSRKLHKAPIKLSKETIGNTTDDFIMDENTEVTQNKDMIARRTSSRPKKALVTRNTDFLW